MKLLKILVIIEKNENDETIKCSYYNIIESIEMMIL